MRFTDYTSIYTKGFTLFFAVLVGSLALAVGLAIFDITSRELTLSNVATQSQYAIYAADTGAECALYWDGKCTLPGCTANGATNTAFATSSTDSREPVSGVICDIQDIATTSVAAGTWPISGATATAATSTFKLYVSDNANRSPTTTCAVVTVAKSGNPTLTTVVSHGYNTCTPGPLQIERVLQVSY